MRKRIDLLLAGLLLFALAAVTSAVLHQVKRPMSDPETGLLRMSGALRVFLVDALWLRMNAHLSEGNESLVLSDARALVSLDPDNAGLLSFLHWHLAFNMAHKAVDEPSRAEWLREGLEIMDQGLARDPDSHLLNHELGATFYLKSETSPTFDRICLERYGRDPLVLAPLYLERAYSARDELKTLLMLFTALLNAAGHQMALGEHAAAAEQWKKVLHYFPVWIDKLDVGPLAEKEELEGYYTGHHDLCILMDRAQKGETGLEPEIRTLEESLRNSPFHEAADDE
jgi:hypothetical protein